MIINSLLDTDVYKLTMQQAVIKKFDDVRVRYQFFDRGDTVYDEDFLRRLKREIRNFKDIRLEENEERFLRNIRFFNDWYVDFLKGFRFNPSDVVVTLSHAGELNISINGPWYRTILWETPLLALISSIWYAHIGATVIRHKDVSAQIDRMQSNSNPNIKVADFGTRRRYGYTYQKAVLRAWKDKFQLDTGIAEPVGTSNLDLARRLDLTPIGTTAHEWYSAHGAMYGYQQGDMKALQHWADVYEGDLGIALCDTYTQKVFQRNFDEKYARLYDGGRIDSGNPYEQGRMLIDHYKKLGIDPSSKQLIFSDGLTFKEATDLYYYFEDKYNVKPSFGIGGNLMNNIDCIDRRNIVMKLTGIKVNGVWKSVIKLSDTPGKETGKESEIKYAKKTLGLPND